MKNNEFKVGDKVTITGVISDINVFGLKDIFDVTLNTNDNTKSVIKIHLNSNYVTNLNSTRTKIIKQTININKIRDFQNDKW